MKLYCKKCNYLLGSGLIEAIKSEVDYKDEHDLVPKGKYISNDKIWNFKDLEIKYLVNEKSINLKNHKEDRRFLGCCGPSEFGLLNQVCPRCKFEIGVLIADCWTPRFIGIDKNKISEKPLWY